MRLRTCSLSSVDHLHQTWPGFKIASACEASTALGAAGPHDARHTLIPRSTPLDLAGPRTLLSDLHDWPYSVYKRAGLTGGVRTGRHAGRYVKWHERARVDHTPCAMPRMPYRLEPLDYGHDYGCMRAFLALFRRCSRPYVLRYTLTIVDLQQRAVTS